MTAGVETWAITYPVPNELGEFGVDIVTQDVEVDSDGRETGRTEPRPAATAATHGTAVIEELPGGGWLDGKASWTLVDADALLATLGYENIGGWRWSVSVGGFACWEVQVRKLA